MRINHNIASLNTYRQLSANGAQTSKSLEKLSSGLRINRAGDDAAGLAISEKMRGQIRGLDQASRNAQDGISLIQTAEGALSETHSILQRMRELSVQSANDTNTESDRGEIQKEINLLTSEINRIGETTQFNKITLLKGELNLQSEVTSKIKGSSIAGNISILDAATNAKASGSAVAAANISAVGGPTVTGTKVYSDPTANDNGPNVRKTSSTVTGSTSGANISALGGTTVTGDVVYAAHSTDDSGPKLERTAAVAQGTSLSGVTAGVIDNYTGPAVTFTKVFTSLGDDAAAGGDGVGNITVANNEMQITLNGESATIALMAKNYDGADGNELKDFLTDLNAAIQGSSLTDKANISAVLNQEGNIEIRTSDATDTLAINGGGLVTNWMQNAPADAFATTAKSANNSLTMTVNGNTQTITLANGAYDLSVSGGTGDQTDFLADLNAKLDTAFGAGNVVASFDGSDRLTFTNALDGASSTISNIGGSAAALLGLGTISDAAGAENNELRVTYNGVQKNLSLAVADYSAGGNDSADDWLADINAKLDTAFGAGNVVASFDGSSKIKFTTANNGDTFTVDGGGAKALVGAAFTNGNSGVGNNSLELTVNGVSKTLTLSDDVYDFSVAGDRTDLAADLNAKLDAAFGAGNVVASFDGSNHLVLTNTLTGTGSTITGIGGAAATALGISTATPVQGTDNTDLSVTYNGVTKTINLAQADYSAGGTDGADDFAANIQAKLNTAFGTGNISVTFDSGKIMFTAANKPDTLSINGGGAAELLKAAPTDTLTTGISGTGNNSLTMTVNGITKSITLADDTYDFSVAEDKTDFLADINSKLDTAFGHGNIAASFNSDNELVFTNNLTGSASTLTGITGTATAVLGLTAASYSTGRNANSTGTITVDGVDVAITLNTGDYTVGGLASDLQTQIRNAGGSLANATVEYIDGSFSITSGTAGSAGSVVIASDELAASLKLTAAMGAVATVGADAVDNGLKLQVGANAAQSMAVDISDMRSQGLKVSGGSTGTITAKDGQVASYVADPNVNNGTNNVNSEYSLDVTTSSKATAAVSVIDDAIAAVSGERSKLGAYQNRLEHTINNLGTSSENLTAAESRIRDVDMAKEMMEFTKNNILSQAAQAMLAQANQQPQGILQLLR